MLFDFELSLQNNIHSNYQWYTISLNRTTITLIEYTNLYHSIMRSFHSIEYSMVDTQLNYYFHISALYF